MDNDPHHEMLAKRRAAAESLAADVAWLNFIRDGGETKRFHTWPVLKEQNIAEHSFGVALLCAFLSTAEQPGMTGALLMAALSHDLVEHQTGDMPAPVKRSVPFGAYMDDHSEVDFRTAWDAWEDELLEKAGFPWLKLLSDKEKRILKVADAAEGALYCCRERAFGNKLITPCYKNFINYFNTEVMRDGGTSEAERILYRFIQNRWREACG